MKIALLTRFPRSVSSRRLKEACQEKGHKVRALNPLLFTLVVDEGAPTLLYKNRPLEGVDAVIPRIGASITFFGTALVRQFEQMGVFTLNSSRAINTSRDKLRTTQLLSRHHIGLPKTAFVKHTEGILPAIECIGGAPVIIKVLEGTQGIGVILAETTKVAEAIVEAMQSARKNVLIQRFVSESRGRDIRALVVGDRVVAAVRRSAQGDEYRSNVHRGGSAEPVQLEPEYERTAIDAARILGLHVAGVDLLEAESGPKVAEVNSSPGLLGLERATGINVAGTIVEYLEEQVRCPEIDHHQRLGFPRGFGVVEVRVLPGSELCGRTIAEAELRERETSVLGVIRDAVPLINPRDSLELLADDVLVCYGHLSTLRALVPSLPVPRKRRK